MPSASSEKNPIPSLKNMFLFLFLFIFVFDFADRVCFLFRYLSKHSIVLVFVF